jgi:hypothetical protein
LNQIGEAEVECTADESKCISDREYRINVQISEIEPNDVEVIIAATPKADNTNNKT